MNSWLFSVQTFQSKSIYILVIFSDKQLSTMHEGLHMPNLPVQ